MGGGGVRVWLMKIVSWNVRGLGGLEERKEIWELAREKLSFVVCIQETKLQSCDDFLCSLVWGPTSHAYSYCPSIGASGAS
jgi:exonuclease III